MDLVEMLSTIWRTKWIILITAAIATGVALYTSLSEVTTYRADAVLVVGTLSPGTSALGRVGGEDKLAVSYTELIYAREVLEKARDLGSLPVSNSQLASDISFVPPPKDNASPYVKLYTVTESPEKSIAEVNAVARGLVAYLTADQENVQKGNRDTVLQQLIKVEAEIKSLQAAPVVDQARIAALDDIRKTLISQFTEVLLSNLPGSSLRIVSEAETASISTPHTVRNASIALFIGLLAGSGIGFAADSVRKSWRRGAE
ncbi:MAG: Wzz/FepE/Etk N-terminal domain-containing protein [Thermoleophilia bacterium]